LRSKKSRVIAEWGKCRGCQICQLICSFVHEKVFNPGKAFIHVRRLGEETEFGVYFLPDCNRCGVCVRFCLYGALSQKAFDNETGSGDT